MELRRRCLDDDGRPRRPAAPGLRHERPGGDDGRSVRRRALLRHAELERLRCLEVHARAPAQPVGAIGERRPRQQPQPAGQFHGPVQWIAVRRYPELERGSGGLQIWVRWPQLDPGLSEQLRKLDQQRPGSFNGTFGQQAFCRHRVRLPGVGILFARAGQLDAGQHRRLGELGEPVGLGNDHQGRGPGNEPVRGDLQREQRSRGARHSSLG